MARTIQKLADEIKRSQAHQFIIGREVKYSVPDKITKGLREVQKQSNKVVSLNDRLAESEGYQPLVEAEDLVE